MGVKKTTRVFFSKLVHNTCIHDYCAQMSVPKDDPLSEISDTGKIRHQKIIDSALFFSISHVPLGELFLKILMLGAMLD